MSRRVKVLQPYPKKGATITVAQARKAARQALGLKP